MRFEDALKVVFDVEGEISNDPNDAGGLTKWGISSVSYPEVLKPTFTKARAIEIYRSDFWMRFRCDQLKSGVDLLMFDCAVNQTQQAARLLQRALKVTADGQIGAETLAAATVADPALLINELAARRAVAYAKHPDVEVFGLGWFRRLLRVTAAANEDARR